MNVGWVTDLCMMEHTCTCRKISKFIQEWKGVHSVKDFFSKCL